MVLHEYNEDVYGTLEDMSWQEVVMFLDLAGVSKKLVKHKNTAKPYIW